ncbi:hypothetical protein F4780DRAFT_724837, partial [Xylariomycetidae sp. FL0641]
TIQTPSGKEYILHARPLAHLSSYFRAALNGEVFVESKTRHFSLSEHCDDRVMTLFTRWFYIYTAAGQEVRRTGIPILGHFPASVLVKAWLFGDYLDMPSFQNDCARRLLPDLDNDYRGHLTDAEVSSQYEYLVEGSKLRELLLDEYCWSFSSRKSIGKRYDLLLGLSYELLQEVTPRLFAEKKQPPRLYVTEYLVAGDLASSESSPLSSHRDLYKSDARATDHPMRPCFFAAPLTLPPTRLKAVGNGGISVY